MHAVATDPTPYYATCPPGTAPLATFSQSPYGQYTSPAPAPSSAAAQDASRVQHAAGLTQRASASPVPSFMTSTGQIQCTSSTSVSTNTTQFPCRWSHPGSCPGWLDRESVVRHLRDDHDFICDKGKVICAWGQCRAALNRRNVARHIVARHLGVKVYCQIFNMPFSRASACRIHERRCGKSF